MNTPPLAAGIFLLTGDGSNMMRQQGEDQKTMDRFIQWALYGAGFLMIVFQTVIIWVPILGPLMSQNTHLGFCFGIMFLVLASKSNVLFLKWIYIICIPISIGLVVYMAVHVERLTMFAGFPEFLDVIIGIIMVGFVLFIVWKQWGIAFPGMAVIGLLYAFWGHHIPGVLGHPYFEFDYIISNISVGFQGIYGMMLNVSVNVVFMMILFGSLFSATGVNQLFVEIGNAIGRYVRGGSGQTAVFSSSFVGMVNAAAVANVAITGAYTIPMMKKSGYRPETAAAIEASASTGGSLTPPVMGVAIFLMAGFLGVSYGDLMLKGIIPALGYYFVASMSVLLIAHRENLPKQSTKIDRSLMLKTAPVFVIPMAVFTVLLLNHLSAGYVAFIASIILLLIAVLQKETRPSITGLIKALKDGVTMATNLGLALACIGIFTKIISLTGASAKLTIFVSSVSDGNLVISLILIMVLSIFMSCAMPPVVAYLVVAIVAAPSLAEMGVPLETAHFFVFYYAVLSAITPPVAGASMVGAQIAATSYIKAGIEGIRMMAPFFMLPYFLVYNPGLLLGSQPILPLILAISALILCLVSAMFALQQFSFKKCGTVASWLYGGISILCVVAGCSHRFEILVIALVLFGGVIYQQWKKEAENGEKVISFQD